MRREDGFSIAELLVAIVVGLLVLGAGYLLMETGLKSFRDIENTTSQAREAGNVLDTVSRDVREGTGITTADPYRLVLMADADDDGAIERWSFYFDDVETTHLKRDRIDPTTGLVTRSDTIATMLRNYADGVPLFTYSSEPGVSLSGTQTGNATIVHVRPITQRQTTPLPPAYKANLDVYLRNVPRH
jgi:type II secretory pathway pseudopilin PulG